MIEIARVKREPESVKSKTEQNSENSMASLFGGVSVIQIFCT